MTSALSLRNIYVEGDDDVAVLSRWFPQLTFVPAGGKDEVRRRVAEDRASYGLLDRDFASDYEVDASRELNNRVVIMRRYTIENYFLDPSIVAEAIRQLIPDADDNETQVWLDENHVQQSIREWGNELALYAAANSIVSEWRDAIMFDRQLGFLRYFGPLPPLPPEEVVGSLRRRLAALTPVDQIGTLLDARYEQVTADLSGWEGYSAGFTARSC
ncbi:MAG TPA: hypothetical protein DEP84_21050 [Chloroflexi bacterium]|nr:hypothetical protein [Chloroflexota bacterium]